MSSPSLATLAIVTLLLAFLTSTTTNIVVQASSTNSQLLLLTTNTRHRQLQQTTIIDTNEDDSTSVPLLPISFTITGVPSSSSLAIDGGKKKRKLRRLLLPEEVNAIITHVEEVGDAIFSDSELYGERYDTINVGHVWTSEYSSMEDDEEGVVEKKEDVSAVSRGPFDGRRKRNLLFLGGHGRNDLQPPPRQLQDDVTGTAVLTVAHGGNVTFNGAYWDNIDPTSEDVTSILISALNTEEERNKLNELLIPLVCTEVVGDGGCNLKVVSVTSDDDGLDGGEDVVVDTMIESVNNETPTITDPVPIIQVEEKEEAPIETSSENISPSSDKKSDKSSKKWIIPVVVGSALVAFALVSLLYIKKRSSTKNNNVDDDDVVVKASKTADSDDMGEGMEVDLEGNVGEGGKNRQPRPPAVWSNAYDAITSPTSSSLRSSSKQEASSAAANAAVAGAAAVIAATAAAAGAAEPAQPSAAEPGAAAPLVPAAGLPAAWVERQ